MKPPLYNQRIKRGLTLLELSTIVVVLMTLTFVLFIGVRAYQQGSHRASCLLNIRNVQQAVRSHQNTQQLKVGDALMASSIYDTVGSVYLRSPICPGSGSYELSPTIPTYGTAALTCSLSGGTTRHAPTDLTGW